MISILLLSRSHKTIRECFLGSFGKEPKFWWKIFALYLLLYFIPSGFFPRRNSSQAKKRSKKKYVAFRISCIRWELGEREPKSCNWNVHICQFNYAHSLPLSCAHFLHFYEIYEDLSFLTGYLCAFHIWLFIHCAYWKYNLNIVKPNPQFAFYS